LKSGATTREPSDAHAMIVRKRLRESVGPSDALEGIREIVSNLLGSEEMALFQVDRGSSALPLIWSFGIDPQEHQWLNGSSESVLKVVRNGSTHIELAGRSAPFTVLVPIRLHGQTVAILAILRLLPQKTGFAKADIEVLQVLSDEAGTAVFGANPDPSVFEGIK
jgi:chemotaxis protein CheD